MRLISSCVVVAVVDVSLLAGEFDGNPFFLRYNRAIADNSDWPILTTIFRSF